MTGARWRRPAHAPGAGRPAPPGPDEVLPALSRALGAPQGQDVGLSIVWQRLAGRSSIYVVRSPRPIDGHSAWVVKRPNMGWTQDDVDSPLGAHDEFVALQRLHAHFSSTDVPVRVPTPVAFLPELDAFAMEYVSGGTVKDLLRYRSAAQPAVLLDALAASGAFLRHLHALETLPVVQVDLKREADAVLEVAEEKLHPLGLELPLSVRRTLTEFPRLAATSPQVWLHGDFGPSNILLATDGTTVGLDAALTGVGHREDDLVRYVALVAGVIRLAPEVVLPPVGAVRRRLESRLVDSYYQSAWPPLFELKLLHQLARRWCRLRELTQQHERGALQSARQRVIGAQMRLLMVDSERRLARSVEG